MRSLAFAILVISSVRYIISESFSEILGVRFLLTPIKMFCNDLLFKITIRGLRAPYTVIDQLSDIKRISGVFLWTISQMAATELGRGV